MPLIFMGWSCWVNLTQRHELVPKGRRRFHRWKNRRVTGQVADSLRIHETLLRDMGPYLSPRVYRSWCADCTGCGRVTAYSEIVHLVLTPFPENGTTTRQEHSRPAPGTGNVSMVMANSPCHAGPGGQHESRRPGKNRTRGQNGAMFSLTPEYLDVLREH